MATSTHRAFLLPDIGEGLTEAEIMRWLVRVGDVVSVNQPIVEIETAKAMVELPSPYAGTVVSLQAAEGDVVAVGTAIFTIDTASSAGSTVPEAGTQSEPTDTRVLVGAGPSAHRTTRRARRSLQEEATALPTPSAQVLASPPVRMLARQLGVDLHALKPSHADGVIRREEVVAAATPGVAPVVTVTPPMAPPPPPNDPAGTIRTPIHGVQRAMADAMVRSAFTAPHVNEWVTVDVTELLHVIDRVRHLPQAKGVSITPLLFVARSLLRAIDLHPQVNASWDGARNQIAQFADVNLGIAAATKRGLIVPNIKAAQGLSLLDLAAALRDLVSRARAGQTTLAELSHGTITITNIGVFGVDGGTPIINPGEAAILCMGQVRDAPWVVAGQVLVRSVMTLTLSFDHRLIDGALGSRLLAEVGKGLEHPELLYTDAELAGGE